MRFDEISGLSDDFKRNEFALLRTLDACRPRVGQASQRIQQAFIQCLAIGGICHYFLSDVFQTDARDVMHGAIQVIGLFAIELQESARVFLDLFRRFDLDQELRDFGLDAAVTADL